MIPVEYVAGVIDARGHIEITTRHGKPQPRVRITTARLGLLTFLADLTGTTVRADDRGYDRRPCGHHCAERHSHVVRQSAYWTVDSGRATVVLFNTLPHMRADTDKAQAALRVGLTSWPPARGNTGPAMARLGWALP